MENQADFYLQLPSEADMPTLLADFYHQDTEIFVDDNTGEETVVNVGESYLVPFTADYAVDVVGILRKATGVMLVGADGSEYPEMQEQPGWHVNIRLIGDNFRSLVEALDTQYGVYPITPSRVWA